MCGIGAVSLSPTSKIPIRQLAHELLLHSEERGKVASGFAYAYGGDNFFVKAPKPGGHLPLKVLPRDARTLIVHTRNATYGDPEENDNNHPVMDDRQEIMLVHNGVITNHKAIRDGEKDVAFPEVDSSVIPWLVREEGVSGLRHIDGWAALAWLDAKSPGELNLARVKGAAPMVVVTLDDGSIVMGSTFPIIHASLINIGYGTRITGGWEVPDLTHIRIRSGIMTGVGNVDPYVAVTAKYKGAVLTYAERQRLEKVTNGGAASYGKDNPVHDTTPKPVGTPGTSVVKAPTTASLVGAGVNPATGTQPSITKVPPATKYGGSFKEAPGPVQVKPGDDPMAAFKSHQQTHPQPTPTVTYAPRKPVAPKHDIYDYLERRLTYWVKWTNEPELDTKDLFIFADYVEDNGYLWNIFYDMVCDLEERGAIEMWGVYNGEGKALFLNELSADELLPTLRKIAEGIPAKGKRYAPKALVDRHNAEVAEKNAKAAESAKAARAKITHVEDEDDEPEISLRDLRWSEEGDCVIDNATAKVVPFDDIKDAEWPSAWWGSQDPDWSGYGNGRFF